MDPKLLDVLVCPITKGPLILVRAEAERAAGRTPPAHDELVSLAAHLAYPIVDGRIVLLESEARELSDEEYQRLRAQHPAHVD
ncbi:MAG: Trm112 family protein [Burkholderiaceae bacterium]|nr:Trm112 family protein [Burkholderiaceae bacterium]